MVSDFKGMIISPLPFACVKQAIFGLASELATALRNEKRFKRNSRRF